MLLYQFAVNGRIGPTGAIVVPDTMLAVDNNGSAGEYVAIEYGFGVDYLVHLLLR